MAPTEYQVWKDGHGEWLWMLRIVEDKRIIAVSGQLYSSRQDCLNAITLVKNSSTSAIT